MLASISGAIKRNFPGLHASVRRTWRTARFPLPKLLMGYLVWIDSRLLGARVTEPHVFHWICDSLKPGDAFFDVGAHQGWMSLAAAKRVGRRGRVVAFEPSPPLVEILQYHQRVNRMQQIQIVAKAVSDISKRRAPFRLVGEGNSYLNALIGTSPANAGVSVSAIEVETVTLNDFCRETGKPPQVIKVDVEGAELLVLRGAEALLRDCRPTLIIAVHPTWMPEGQTAEELFSLLRTHRYRIADSKVVRYEESDFGDYLCVPE
jgi:FkbM family methyltransferase